MVVLSVSAVMIVISPSAAITAVTTWITLVEHTSKLILREIGRGEGVAMTWWKLGRNESSRRKIRRKKEAAIAALLTQRNIEEAAKTAGIPRTRLCQLHAALRGDL
jgi:hypothetical protein